MNFTAIGILLDVLGVFLMVIHSLYEFGLDTTNAIVSKKEGERKFSNSVIVKVKSNMKLTSAEKEQFIFLVKENCVVNASIYIINVWLFINRWIFRFTPWLEETPRKVNRFLWNLLAFSLIILGFIFQFIGSFSHEITQSGHQKVLSEEVKCN